MYTSPVPLMVIRSEAPALIEVNGALLGECSRSGYVTMPVGDGCYYISAFPLTPLRLSVTRRAVFENGVLSSVSPDISACAWPGGIYEFLFDCGGAHEETPLPGGTLKTALDFFDAVRRQDRVAALALMHTGLVSLIDFGSLCGFCGAFVSARPPIADASGRYIGLIASERPELMSARLYELEYRDGLIYNVTEL